MLTGATGEGCFLKMLAYVVHAMHSGQAYLLCRNHGRGFRCARRGDTGSRSGHISWRGILFLPSFEIFEPGGDMNDGLGVVVGRV